ncbi:MAG: hypothetical protein K1X29_09635 [Bdellovibrionales bacterium]|nr:hypothetical protein [Bdellovibrionales bacterium]
MSSKNARYVQQFKRLFCFITFLITGCSVNILETFSDPYTDEALYEDAKQLINQSNYSAALTKFSGMTTSFLARREVAGLKATAYGGLCGLNFLNLLTSLNNIGATRFLLWLLQTFPGGNSTLQNYCIQAETLIKTIGLRGSNRTADENFLMAFIAFAKIGTILTRYGDSSPANGTVDAGFDPCAGGSLPSADAKEVATGFTIAIDALQNIGTSTVGANIVSQVTTVCALLPPAYATLCSSPAIVDTTSITANDEKAIRTLLNESQNIGLGTCTGDAAACACP